jgi:hypothetical protein
MLMVAHIGWACKKKENSNIFFGILLSSFLVLFIYSDTANFRVDFYFSGIAGELHSDVVSEVLVVLPNVSKFSVFFDTQ